MSLTPEAGLLKTSQPDKVSSTKCDQNHSNHCYDFSPTVLCISSQTWIVNKLTSQVVLLHKRSSSAAALGVIKFIRIMSHLFASFL
jgi:hypothetical protein